MSTTMNETQDVHIVKINPLISPREMKEAYPMSEKATETVLEARNTIKRMLRGKEDRFLMIVGPCSIHDAGIAEEYAQRLAALQQKVKDRIVLVMRVYFEKPRTTVGWKGLINDPYLNDSTDIEHGITTARKILLNINDLGLPAATEFLDPIVPQYIAELVTWAAIGARTTESQTHREMSSGLSMPVGFKNSTEGNLQIAIDALHSSNYPHSFLGIDQEGKASIISTSGNVWGHIILRGGRSGPNYDRESVEQTKTSLEKAQIPPYVMIDCSHANSSKDFTKQETVLQSIIEQKQSGQDCIFGAMLESNIHEGKQNIPADLSELKYGVSVTDGCISWETTERIIQEAYKKLG